MSDNERDRLLKMLEGKYFYSKTYETLLAFKGGDIYELKAHKFIEKPYQEQANVLIREAIKELFNIDSYGVDIKKAIDTYIDIIK